MGIEREADKSSLGGKAASIPASQRKHHETAGARPTRSTKFGKANARRDIIILLSFIGIGGLLCVTLLNDVGKKTPDRKKQNRTPRKGRRSRKQTAPKPVIEEIEKPPAGACGFYLAESSLPGKGIGLYSTRVFDIGDVLLKPDAGLQFSLADIDSEYVGDLSVSSLAMLLKPHPVLGNVRGGYTNSSKEACLDVVAKKRIEPGNEIFIDLNEIPIALREFFYKLSPEIPRRETYDLADAVVFDLNTGSTRRQALYGRSPERGGGLLDPKSPKMIKKVVARFNKDVSALLPETSRELDKIMRNSGSTALTNLSNRSLAHVVKDGVCFDGTKVATSTIERSGTGVFAVRSFGKGDVVSSAPLFLTADSPDNLASKAHCFQHGATRILFCPLSNAIHIKHQNATSEPSSASAKECAKGPNVFLRWSTWNGRNNIAKKVQPNELLKAHRVGLSFDIVANRKIKEGEEVLMDYGSRYDEIINQDVNSKGSASLSDKPIPLNDHLFPESWKQI